MNLDQLDTAPRITLGGRQWPVPMLTARQNKIIDPLILGLLPVFAQWQTDPANALSRLGAEQYNHLLEIALVAVRRAHPEVTQDQFMDLPITLPELIAAFSIIAQQTGVFTRDRGEVQAGEA